MLKRHQQCHYCGQIWMSESFIFVLCFCSYFSQFPEESEMAQARMKGLDETPTTAGAAKQHKDMNTFINNQLKFDKLPSDKPAIPPANMKCNILKAKAQEQYKQGSKGIFVKEHSFHNDLFFSV